VTGGGGHESLPTNPGRLRQLNVPARLARRARKRLIRLCDDNPHQDDLILAWQKVRALGNPP
jgi:hypothetical protein